MGRVCSLFDHQTTVLHRTHPPRTSNLPYRTHIKSPTGSGPAWRWLAVCLYIRVPLWIHREMVTSDPALAHTDAFSVVCGVVPLCMRKHVDAHQKSYFITGSCSIRREGTPGLEKVPRSPLRPKKSLDSASRTLIQKKTTGHTH